MKEFLKFKPKKIIFLGWHPVLSEKIKINNKNNLETEIICSLKQSKIAIKSTKINITSINGINKKFFDLLKKKKSKSKDILFISHAFPWIINKNIIKKFFNNNLLNIHHSRLPYDSGRAATSWRIMRNDKINSTIIHQIDGTIDNGPIIFRKDEIFPTKCRTPNDYEEFICIQSTEMYEDFINCILKEKKLLKKHQSDFIGRYNPKLNTKINGFINWDNNSELVYRLICAFDEPYEGAKTRYNGQIVKIKDVYLHGGEAQNHPLLAGSVLRNDKKWIIVATTDNNCLIIKKVINNKKQNIVQKIKRGTRFYSNISDIIKSRRNA